MPLDDIDVAAESRSALPSPAGADIGSLLRPMTEGLADLQTEKNARSERIYSDTEKNLEHDQRQMAQAYAATGVGKDELKPWDHAKQEEKYRTDPIEAFGSLGSVFGIVASAFTHAPMENALNASAAAIKATKEGNDEQRERAWRSYKENIDLVMKRHQIQRDAYSDAVTLMKTNMAAGEARMSMEAARFGDKKAQFLLENGMSEELFKLIDSRNKAAEGMLSASNAITEDGMKKKIFEEQAKAIDENFKANPNDPNAGQMAAAHKLAAWQTIFRGDKQSPQNALMGRFFMEKPNATAEEAADFAEKHGITHTYRPTTDGAIIQALKDEHKAQGKPEPTAGEIAAAVASSKGRASGTNANLTGDRQRAQDVATYREELKNAKNEDGSPKHTPQEIANMAAKRESELKATANAPSGNRLDDMQKRIDQIKYSEQDIDKVLAILKRRGYITGAGQIVGKPTESLSNVLGSNSTDWHEVDSLLAQIKQREARIALDAQGRPLASEGGYTDKIVRGQNWGDTKVVTIKRLKELKKDLEEYRADTEKRKTGSSSAPAGGAAPAEKPSGGEKPWERDRRLQQKSEIDSDEVAA